MYKNFAIRIGDDIELYNIVVNILTKYGYKPHSNWEYYFSSGSKEYTRNFALAYSEYGSGLIQFSSYNWFLTNRKQYRFFDAETEFGEFVKYIIEPVLIVPEFITVNHGFPVKFYSNGNVTINSDVFSKEHFDRLVDERSKYLLTKQYT